MAKGNYTDSDKSNALAILASTGGNLLQAAKMAGVPRKTLAYWATQTGVRTTAPVATGGEQKGAGGIATRRLGTPEDRQEMIEQWRKAVTLNAAELTDPEKVKKASLRENTIAAGTAQDKFNILSGGATSRTEQTAIIYVQPNALRDLSIAVLENRAPKPVAIDVPFSSTPQSTSSE